MFILPFKESHSLPPPKKAKHETETHFFPNRSFRSYKNGACVFPFFLGVPAGEPPPQNKTRKEKNTGAQFPPKKNGAWFFFGGVSCR